MIETACLKTISWLEKSGHLPENLVYDLKCAQSGVEDSVNDFISAANELSDSDYADLRSFAARLMHMDTRAQDLRNDVESIEQALVKTLLALPEGLFEDK